MTLGKWSLGLVAWCALTADASPAAAQTPPSGFDRAGWLADLEALRTAMTRHYPNLEWAAERGMNLPAVVARAEARLEIATDEHQARFALTRFVQSFADGHLGLDWPALTATAPPAPTPSAVGPRPPLCERLGFPVRPDEGAIGVRLPGYAPLPAAGIDNPIGIVRAGGARVGILRIPQFMPGRADCEQAAQQLSVGAEDACEENCRNRIANRAETLFVARLEQRVRDLAAARPDILLVDLARNGGGSDSAISAARMLGGADLAAPKAARMAGPALTVDLAEDRAGLRAGLAGASAADAALLQRLDAELAIAEAQSRATTCDRSPLWRGQPIACSALVSGPFYAGGLLPLGIRGRADGPDWIDPVDATARHLYTPGLWRGPLLLLVDGDTASAAELFAAMLQDAARALVIGSPSFGSGCGWNLPQRPVTLPHSGGRLLMPDCTRYRRDGRNEVDGIQPDILVGLRTYDSPRQRAERLAPVLTGVAVRAVAARPRR